MGSSKPNRATTPAAMLLLDLGVEHRRLHPARALDLDEYPIFPGTWERVGKRDLREQTRLRHRHTRVMHRRHPRGRLVGRINVLEKLQRGHRRGARWMNVGKHSHIGTDKF